MPNINYMDCMQKAYGKNFNGHFGIYEISDLPYERVVMIIDDVDCPLAVKVIIDRIKNDPKYKNGRCIIRPVNDTEWKQLLEIMEPVSTEVFYREYLAVDSQNHADTTSTDSANSSGSSKATDKKAGEDPSKGYENYDRMDLINLIRTLKSVISEYENMANHVSEIIVSHWIDVDVMMLDFIDSVKCKDTSIKSNNLNSIDDLFLMLKIKEKNENERD